LFYASRGTIPARLPISQIVGGLCSRSPCNAAFKKFLGKIFPAEPESDGGGEHNASPGNAESHHDNVLSNTQLLKRHCSCEQQDARASGGCDEPSWRQSRIDSGDEDGLRSEVRKEISREDNHCSCHKM